MTGAEIEPRLAAFLQREGLREDTLRQLAGDASTRRYHRVATDAGGSVIVMQGEGPFPEPRADGRERFAFARWQTFYRDLGVRVPSILSIDHGAGLAVLEDLGDEMLQHRIERLGAPACEELYRLAVRWGQLLAREGTTCWERTPEGEREDDDPLVPRRLAWEMDFFLAHSLGHDPEGLEELAGSELGAARSLLHRLCEELHLDEKGERRPLVLCHRDYHARNLVVLDEGEDLAVIDFQDTRRGPRAYDLASLVFDPYVSLPPALVERLVEAWRPEDLPPGEWGRELSLSAGQRLIKAAGSYAWLGRVRGRGEYLRWLSPALARAFEALAAWPGREELEARLRALGIEW